LPQYHSQPKCAFTEKYLIGVVTKKLRQYLSILCQIRSQMSENDATSSINKKQKSQEPIVREKHDKLQLVGIA